MDETTFMKKIWKKAIALSKQLSKGDGTFSIFAVISEKFIGTSGDILDKQNDWKNVAIIEGSVLEKFKLNDLKTL